MSTIQQLMASAVRNHFSSSDMQETAGFAHFVTVTDGLTGQQAATVPAERFNSVWAVVNHLTSLQDKVCRALRGEATETPPPGTSWVPLGEVNDANWLAARQRALDSNHRLSDAIASLTDAQLKETLPGWFNYVAEQAILKVHAHIGYHTAEIVAIRHMLGLWIDHPFV